jgi:hypothetical protein
MLLALASVIFLGSESLWTSNHILLSQIWDFPFRRLLRLAVSRWRYSTPPSHRAIVAANIPRDALYSLGADSTETSVVLLLSADGTENISRSCYCCVATNFRRDVFTSALRSNELGEACVTQQRAINTRTSIVACVFPGSCGLTVLDLGKYAISSSFRNVVFSNF